VACPGLFFVTVKVLFPSGANFAEGCVVAATLLAYLRRGAQLHGTDGIVSD
jgi:hypothetical protein